VREAAATRMARAKRSVVIRKSRSTPTSDLGHQRTCSAEISMSALPLKADIRPRDQDVCFSNRPFGVKRFQTIRRCSVDVAHGLVLLFGIGTRALPSWDSKTRWNNLMGGLAVSCRQVHADILSV
jgi:hypothetical protein